MQNKKFGRLNFVTADNKITINGLPFAEVGVSGRDCPYKLGAKLVCSSETGLLDFVSYVEDGDKAIVTQKNDIISVKTEFEKYASGNAVSVSLSVRNESGKPVTLENASFLYGLDKTVDDTDKIRYTRFVQSHHAECQPRTATLFDYGLSALASVGQARVSGMNVGSWSTKEELPTGILELNGDGYLAFQINSNNSWYYEISDVNKRLYLCLDGGNSAFNGWHKRLNPYETYRSETFVLAFGKNLNDVLGSLTDYRRAIAGKCQADENLPVIFNEYMHFSWDSPDENRTKSAAARVAELGVEYYVIDCGWHDEVDGKIIYPYVGKWKESHARFPSGLRKTTDYIRSLGMKAGLWIEPEIVGCKCADMLDYYGDDCFLHRNGEKILVRGSYFLDYRKTKVVDYMTETIRRMVEDYGADYIKLDYNEDLGVGVDCENGGFCEGLKENAAAYLGWIDRIKKRFPSVLFESCSSGGMRMDYKTLSKFSIVSTSDQIDYKKYPYIAGNVLSAVLPEQAAVWSYPVVDDGRAIGEDCELSEKWVEENIGKERVIINTVNAMLGRIHLASRVWLLPADGLSLVTEGIDYYKSLIAVKKVAKPYFPIGFTKFGQKHVAAGIKTDDKIYLAVWNLGGDREFVIDTDCEIVEAKVGYPRNEKINCQINEKSLKIEFSENYQARIIEIKL